jgi:L-methionine (R)-S-oxide reductase
LNYDIAENKIKEIIIHTESSKVLREIVNFLYENFTTYNWIGIYLVEENNLILGPWQGKQATEHTKIPIGYGICGSAAKTGKTEIISDVAKDGRYLACFISTKSEIVVPIKKNNSVVGEIDIDSDNPNAFDKNDKIFLEKIANKISDFI